MQQIAYVIIISSLCTWPVSQVCSAVYCRAPKWIGSWVALRVLVPQELLGGPARSASPGLLGNLLGSSEGPRTSGPLHGLLHKGPSPPLFPPRAPSPDYFNSHLQPSAGTHAKLRLSVFNSCLEAFIKQLQVVCHCLAAKFSSCLPVWFTWGNLRIFKYIHIKSAAKHLFVSSWYNSAENSETLFPNEEKKLMWCSLSGLPFFSPATRFSCWSSVYDAWPVSRRSPLH